ncbi:MAG: M23 family metallopeptidase [Clostridiales bacterium]|nr:M23 family metallopeptidase [Clostridiales bacterium]
MEDESIKGKDEINEVSSAGYLKGVIFSVLLFIFLFSFGFFMKFKTNIKISENKKLKKTVTENKQDVEEDFGFMDEGVEIGFNSNEIEENSFFLNNDSATLKEISDSSSKKVKEIYDDGFVLPVSGQIIKECSLDDLVYSKTLDDWRTHNGIDIECAIGTPVKAARDGLVEKIYQSDELGITLVLNHGNGLNTVYSNLQDINFIEIGKKVKTGDIIGGVGSSSSFECADPPHLHFEFIKNGEVQKPMNYFSSNYLN